MSIGLAVQSMAKICIFRSTGANTSTIVCFEKNLWSSGASVHSVQSNSPLRHLHEQIRRRHDGTHQNNGGK